ncbi:hypothetical protein DJ138_18605 [Salmonella enterica]|uniref:Uncharacterized protein n=2 Tax=Salmonella enterica I TaxID=59201 RepID=A0A3Y5QM32_SALET|nr:hypothetical protein [Salmonella enterica subsp. enterica serovar Weltevreden]EAA5681901.1 hypothetical protein [Salmonella enterica subsp. enterica]EAA8121215.1 hypothetical protein [Salmonella enterica]EBQ5984228.1 hypothetical protein [Salmonella enterica subsp. houtenae serovar Houten]EBS5119747.1 hypothetical protein [Salmonella enterica subsp. enterica serovar Telelkebir]EBU8742370.1 hypothetical protein [Salmonella enterica subsp. enterica serovar Typhimurium]EBW2564228.1 hypothetic
MLKLRQPGMETRCPAGAGQRQRSWLGAKHDSPGSRREVARLSGELWFQVWRFFSGVSDTSWNSGEILTSSTP